MAEDWGHQTNLEVIERLIRLEDRFLVDAGCGSGELSRELAARGASVLGIEPDPVQADINAKAEATPNVGFVQAGAGAIPVEPGSVDGVIFSNSLHHVPAIHYRQVFQEMRRVLTKRGFVYVQEPVANGSHQYAIELFHDETEVRLQAYRALVELAMPRFARMREVYYDVDHTYRDFEEFADHYCLLSYNNYTESDVRNDKVKRRFESCANSHGSFTITQPMRVNLYMQPLL
ncbi:hypothetical protein AB833_23925 [Chromatiales bacterium (ex Bugula neritina AB1)]|nr:hypothetical protein AB833_23925 [Chromatiales bacterium (ex Bugula neritina AB1)]